MQHHLGIISDTHLPHFSTIPEAVWEHFAGVELIIHAGDLSVLSVISHLETIAPVIAVQGNIEREEVMLALPIKREIVVGRCRIGVVHIVSPSPMTDQKKQENLLPLSTISDTEKGNANDAIPVASGDLVLSDARKYARNARQEFPDARVVVFGHSHNPCNEQIDGQLLFNPGSATDRRRQPACSIGLLHVDDETQQVYGEILALPLKP